MSSDIDEIRLDEARQDDWDALEIEHARKLLGVRNRAPKAVLSGGLLDMAQAAASLGIGVRTLREHLERGTSATSMLAGVRSAARRGLHRTTLPNFRNSTGGSHGRPQKRRSLSFRVRVQRSSISGHYGLHVEARSPRVRTSKAEGSGAGAPTS